MSLPAVHYQLKVKKETETDQKSSGIKTIEYEIQSIPGCWDLNPLQSWKTVEKSLMKAIYFHPGSGYA